MSEILKVVHEYFRPIKLASAIVFRVLYLKGLKLQRRLLVLFVWTADIRFFQFQMLEVISYTLLPLKLLVSSHYLL